MFVFLLCCLAKVATLKHIRTGQWPRQKFFLVGGTSLIQHGVRADKSYCALYPMGKKISGGGARRATPGYATGTGQNVLVCH